MSKRRGVEKQDRQPGHESGHRPDGQVQAAARDDERLTDRDGRDEGAARQDIGDIVEAEEAGIQQPAEKAQKSQRQKGRDGADLDAPPRGARSLVRGHAHTPTSPRFASTPVASTTMACSFIASLLDFADDAPAAHDDDAVAEPDQLRHFRRHDDHASPLRRERGDEAIDLLLGADVHAARRLVDDHDMGIEQHHFGEQQFLLIAAGHLARQQTLVSDPDIETAHGVVERAFFLGAIDERPAAKFFKRRQRQVGRDRLLEQQAFALAVLGEIDGSGAHAGAGVGPALGDAVEANLARALAQAEQGFEQLGAARAYQSGKAQDLARPHAEAGVLGVARGAEMGHFEGRRVGRDGQARRVQGEQVAPDHQARHVYLLEFSGRSRRDALAVAQYRDDVGNRFDLLQSMRDVENRDARGLEFADATQQCGRLDLSQRRARLVEDDDPARRREGARYLRQLPMCDREFLHGRRH